MGIYWIPPDGLSILEEMTHANVALSDILGAVVVDSTGAVAGRVREVALSPQEDPIYVSLLVVKTR